MHHSFHQPNKEIDPNWLYIPYAYLLSYKTKSKNDTNLVIVEINKSTVIYSFRNNDGCKVGMLRRSKILTKNKRSYFVVEGKKVYLN